MMRAVLVKDYGGPDVLDCRETEEPSLAPGRLLVDVRSAGVNYLDLHQRAGRYQMPLPFVLGDEGVGTVIATSDPAFAIGDRVVWTGGQGSYAARVSAPAVTTVRLPDDVSDDDAFVFAQGLTAHYLATSILPLHSGMTAFVHAGAGGVGGLLVQVLKLLGVRVIAAVSTEVKAAIATEAGADLVMRYGEGDLGAAVRRTTGGEGVDIVYDGVGRETFDLSLSMLRRRGVLTLFGMSSGPVPPVDPMILLRQGSVSLVRPGLADFIETRAALQARADDLFNWVREGSVKVRIGARYPLERASDAHRALEARATVGKVLLDL